MVISSDMASLGEDGFADSAGVKIHYVTRGTGPLIVLIHGIPGFWYDWRSQMPALAQHFQVVAIDQRGFNLSDKPDGVENSTLDKLVSDVDAVVQHFGRSKAIIVGHDSGGWISWHYAMAHSDKTDGLVVVMPSTATAETRNNGSAPAPLARYTGSDGRPNIARRVFASVRGLRAWNRVTCECAT